MKRNSVLFLAIFTVALVFALSGCFLFPGTDYSTNGNIVSGRIFGVPNPSVTPVTLKDDLGESFTIDSSYYSLSIKPGVRTLTYSCQGYTAFSTTVSVIGNVSVNVTLNPVAQGAM